MAEVYAGLDHQLGRSVAVKMLDSGSLAAAGGDLGMQRARFEREARIAARMTSAHIVTVHDSGVYQDGRGVRPFLVMELIDGPNLRQRLREPCALPVLLNYLDGALAGLVYAHSEHHVVHRDIKPENIMVCPDGSAKLTDFGIAVELRENFQRLTRAHYQVATPAYAAPESLNGGQLTQLSDVFSFARVCWETLSHVHNGAPLPEPVQVVLARALEPEPAARQRSAREFQAQFRQAVAHVAWPLHVAAHRPVREGGGMRHTSVLTPGDMQDSVQVPTPPKLPTDTTAGFLLAPVIESRQRVLERLSKSDPRYVAGVIASAAVTGVLLGWLAFLLIGWVIVTLVDQF
ncbi:serine/threonine-protein kinase [Nocardia huaxiensis]|uniref:non-specific serine/threonine protein kinase n=2 Tax=Nocardia huaxiensis TaxID=2755382 RepID=A0A7D6VCF7_9NOCA|nr:serine/threonine-protein kinase [Nocardia huaxiensis]QLY33132.1 serine/threonine protein kinase [Nocardia huaxiensis]UFS93097.1 serine/threonine protein kinase [Nocardia huaxiensis]